MGVIYQIRNKENNKRYIGSSNDFNKRKLSHIKCLLKNKHWNFHLQRSFNLAGINNFEFEIVEDCGLVDKKKLHERENFFIAFFDSKNIEKGYNIADACGGNIIGNLPKDIYDKHCKNQSRISKERYAKRSDEEKIEYKEKLKGEGNPNFGNKWSDEQKLKASKRLKLYYSIDENRHKISESVKLYFKENPEAKEKISEFAKTKIGEKNPFYGKTHSDEFKKIQSERMKGKKPVNRRPVIIDNIKYDSLGDASKALKINISVVLWRVKSENKKFDSWRFYESNC